MANQIQPGAQLYTAGFGLRPENVEVPHYDVRAPTSADANFPLGKRWIDYIGQNEYSLVAFATSNAITSAVWSLLGGNSALSSVAPTANQTTVSTAGGVATVGLASAITAPGSLTTTTTLASGTTLTAGSSLAVTTTAVIGTGLTVTAGAITATNGNLTMSTAGNKVLIPATTTTTAGAYAAGSVALGGGTGVAVVNTSAVTANSIIQLTYQALGTIPAPASVGVTARTPNTSFTIQSNASTDTSTIGWIIFN